MREILFRGKRVDNGDWAYGYLYITHNGEYEIGNYDNQLNIERLTRIVTPETVGQYTGLTDKNGKKIFEGDICKSIDGVFLICFDKEQCGFVMQFFDYPRERLDMREMQEDTQVIGNIYDNPELLGGEDR